MKLGSLREALIVCVDSLSRGKGTYVLARLTDQERAMPENRGRDRFSLCTSAAKASRIPDGVIITLAMSREQVEQLRAMCDEALKEGSHAD
jgi:hypothetical protein